MANDIKWKKHNRMSACTSQPWAVFIPPMDRPEILRIIRTECVEQYGYAMDECPKRLTCDKKECMGRPLPWKSKTALPYLEQLKSSGLIKNEELFIVTDCRTCPAFDKCSSPCNQIQDFLNKKAVGEPSITYNEDLSNIVVEADPVTEFVNSMKDVSKIPWDVLTERRREVIKKYVYERLDYREVARQVGLFNQAPAKYELYAGLTKLAEYGRVRAFLEEKGHLLSDMQWFIMDSIYNHNYSIKQVSETLGITYQSVSQQRKTVLKQYNIKFPKYVRKKNGKLIYNTLKVIKD